MVFNMVFFYSSIFTGFSEFVYRKLHNTFAPVINHKQLKTTTMKQLTKSGHETIQQNCFSEYREADNTKYLGYEYYISSCILYIYEGRELIQQHEITSFPLNSRKAWAEYYINRLVTGIIF